LMRRDLRIRLDLMTPDVASRLQEKIRGGRVEFEDKAYHSGERVSVQMSASRNHSRQIGVVTRQDGELHYWVDVDGREHRRHVNQLAHIGPKPNVGGGGAVPMVPQGDESGEETPGRDEVPRRDGSEDGSRPNRKPGESKRQRRSRTLMSGVPSRRSARIAGRRQNGK
jgi:hypothetical protein